MHGRIAGARRRRRSSVPGFTYVRTVGAISEYRLVNGFTVLLMPDRSAPVVTFMVTYMVGSRNGHRHHRLDHLLEHLMFRAPDAYNDAKGNSVKQYLETVGGTTTRRPGSTGRTITQWFRRTRSTNYVAIEGGPDAGTSGSTEADRERR